MAVHDYDMDTCCNLANLQTLYTNVIILCKVLLLIQRKNCII